LDQLRKERKQEIEDYDSKSSFSEQNEFDNAIKEFNR